MSSFYDLLASSKHIIAVAGAGLSAASGIPTFRGPGGLWRKHDAISLATPEGFANDPSLVWQFYHYRRETALRAQPNAAHKALAAFAIPSIRSLIAPDATFTLITQNVDGLSPRAYDQILDQIPADDRIPPSPHDPPILEMHGRLFDVRCSSPSCHHVYFNTDSPICPALAGTELLTLQADSGPHIDPSQLPRCPKCNALARPGVVWFGETPKNLDQIARLVKRADLCLVIGTSSTVYPAAGYARKVQNHGGKVAVFNVDRSEGDDGADILFLGPCENTLPKALQVESIVNPPD